CLGSGAQRCHLDVFPGRQPVKQATVLERPGKTEASPAMGGRRGDGLTVNGHVARGCCVVSGEDVDQRRLAGSVRTDQAVNSARSKGEVHLLQRLDGAEIAGDVDGAQALFRACAVVWRNAQSTVVIFCGARSSIHLILPSTISSTASARVESMWSSGPKVVFPIGSGSSLNDSRAAVSLSPSHDFAFK